MPRIATTPPGEISRNGLDTFGAPQYRIEISAKAITRTTGHFTQAQIGRKEAVRNISSPFAPIDEAIGPSRPPTMVALSSTETRSRRSPRNITQDRASKEGVH